MGTKHPPFLCLKLRTSRETDRFKMKVVILLFCMMTFYCTSETKKYLIRTAEKDGDYKMKNNLVDDGDYKMKNHGDDGDYYVFDNGDYKMKKHYDDDGDYLIFLKMPIILQRAMQEESDFSRCS